MSNCAVQSCPRLPDPWGAGLLSELGLWATCRSPDTLLDMDTKRTRQGLDHPDFSHTQCGPTDWARQAGISQEADGPVALSLNVPTPQCHWNARQVPAGPAGRSSGAARRRPRTLRIRKYHLGQLSGRSAFISSQPTLALATLNSVQERAGLVAAADSCS